MNVNYDSLNYNLSGFFNKLILKKTMQKRGHFTLSHLFSYFYAYY